MTWHRVTCVPVKQTNHPFMKRILERRIALRMPRAELAEISGYACYMIARYERGENTPGLLPIADLAEAVGMELVLREKEAA